MKTKNTEELLKDLIRCVKNHEVAKATHQHEKKEQRIREINLIQAEIISRVK